ncbi:MAG: (d)CMP kinase [Spirochaetia bacterium]|nr:(d)CMP kinase [Spirochaetia bacterium]
MIVAIDGPAGCGKSTIARMLSQNLGFLYVNSGNIYRAISLWAVEHGISPEQSSKIIEEARKLDLRYQPDGSLTMNGRKLDKELRSSEVDAVVSQISAIPEIREIVNMIVHESAKGRDAVAEGRDITTVVFPNAEVKFYLDASVEERARRRLNEHVSNQNADEIIKNIQMRDKIDKSKPVGALKIAEDAIYLDTSGLTIEQVYAKVYSKILYTREEHGQ